LEGSSLRWVDQYLSQVTLCAVINIQDNCDKNQGYSCLYDAIVWQKIIIFWQAITL